MKVLVLYSVPPPCVPVLLFIALACLLCILLVSVQGLPLIVCAGIYNGLCTAVVCNYKCRPSKLLLWLSFSLLSVSLLVELDYVAFLVMKSTPHLHILLKLFGPRIFIKTLKIEMSIKRPKIRDKGLLGVVM